MTLEVDFVLELVGPNYIAWKIKMIDVIKSKNLWILVNGEFKNLVDAQVVIKWEEKCDQVRGIIGQTVSDSL